MTITDFMSLVLSFLDGLGVVGVIGAALSLLLIIAVVFRIVDRD